MTGGMLSPALAALRGVKLNSPVEYPDPHDQPSVGETDKSGFGTSGPINLNSPAMPMWQRYFDRMKYLGVDRIVPPNGALRGLRGIEE